MGGPTPRPYPSLVFGRVCSDCLGPAPICEDDCGSLLRPTPLTSAHGLCGSLPPSSSAHGLCGSLPHPTLSSAHGLCWSLLPTPRSSALGPSLQTLAPLQASTPAASGCWDTEQLMRCGLSRLHSILTITRSNHSQWPTLLRHRPCSLESRRPLGL